MVTSYFQHCARRRQILQRRSSGFLLTRSRKMLSLPAFQYKTTKRLEESSTLVCRLPDIGDYIPMVCCGYCTEREISACRERVGVKKFHSDGHRFVSGGEDRRVAMQELPSSLTVHPRNGPGMVTQVALPKSQLSHGRTSSPL